MSQEDARDVLLRHVRQAPDRVLVRSILDPDHGWERSGGLTETGRAVVVEVARLVLAERRQAVAS